MNETTPNIDPHHTMLLAMDYQAAIVGSIPEPDGLLARVAVAIATARGVDTLILAGIATSGVVLSTMRDAADRDYRLYVLEDGCFDRDPAVHELLMEKVFPRQGYVVSIVDLPDLLTPE